MKTIEIVSRDKCVGCCSCVEACPTDSISFIFDNQYCDYYPKVNNDKCVECGLCQKVCPVIASNHKENSKIIKCYIGINTDEYVRNGSTSGGVFSGLAKALILKGYVVYGARINNEGIVEHIDIKTIDSIALIRGSKYVRSDISSVFKLIVKNLRDGTKVAFTGTGCQCAAIQFYVNNFAPSKKDNLFLIDVVCHGVAKPYIWKKHFDDLNFKYGNIHSLNFRDKDTGWHSSGLSFLVGEKKYYFPSNNDSFINAYSHNLCLRTSCFYCEYKGTDRLTDITIGDAWGIDEKSSFNDDKGASLVIVNSQFGMDLLIDANNRNDVLISECRIEDYISHNPCIISSIKPNKKQLSFDRDIQEGISFDYAVHKNTKTGLFKKIIRKLRALKTK